MSHSGAVRRHQPFQPETGGAPARPGVVPTDRARGGSSPHAGPTPVEPLATEAHRRTSERTTCPVGDVLALVGSKWTTLIVAALATGPHRFGTLHRSVEGLTVRVLSRQLRDLERDGLIDRRVLSTDPPAVEYSLTALGRELDGALTPIRSWAQASHGRMRVAQRDFDVQSSAQDRTPWQVPRPMAPRPR